MKRRDRVARAKTAPATIPARLLADGQTHMAPWRTLITAVHPHPSVKINHGATFLVTDQQGNIPVSDDGDYFFRFALQYFPLEPSERRARE